MDPRPEEHGDEVEEQVSRLLAELGGSDEQQMPEDVAARLDDVLAGLVAERAGEPLQPTDPGRSSAPGRSPGPHEPTERQAEGPVPPEEVVGVAELASRRRSWAPRLLLAAAAVTVVALGVGVGVDDLTGAGSGDSALTSEAADDRALSDGAEAGGGTSLEGPAGPDAATDRVPLPELSGSSRNGHGEEGVVRLRSRSLSADVQRVADAGVASRANRPQDQDQDLCVRPALARGDQWLRVRLDGRPAVLVLRAPEGGRRTAEVFACRSPRSPVASTAVVAR